MSIVEVQTGEPDEFRNKLYNIDKEGNRSKIYPHKPSGKLYRARTIVSVFLLAFLFLAPFVKFHGMQFMLFNILERKFVIFGIVFFPQDMFVLVLGILTLLLSIFLFTAVLGRIWCGWLCPQTVFLEMLFRKIEYAIEGSGTRQRLFDASPMTASKFSRKALKHIIFFSLSVLIANTFLAYIIGSDAVRELVRESPTLHPVGFSVMILFSFVFYAVFARFREQACIVVCPYGRYQSALVDIDTVAVTYDHTRGEPRGKFTKEDKQAILSGAALAAERGDCIDCDRCYHVCPTGIDIRNGIQLECVNCTACMDACDEVMDKVKKPRGLIRWASASSLGRKEHRWLTNRVKAYTGVWFVVTTIFLTFFFLRPMTEVLILRQPGTLNQSGASGEKINFYVLNVVNKHYEAVPIEVRVLSPAEAKISVLGDVSTVPAVTEKSVRLMLSVPQRVIQNSDSPVRFGVYSNGNLIKQIDSRFIATQ